ncbi:hypothetical protein D3C73_1483180 [compost metagenome]
MSDRAERTAFIDAAMGMGDIFNNFQIILICNVHNRVHIGGVAEIVDDNDRFGSFIYAVLNVFRVKT